MSTILDIFRSNFAKTIKLCRWNDSDVSASADQRDRRHPGLLLNCQQPSQPSVLFKILKYIVGILLTCAYSTKFNWSASCIMLCLYPIYIPLNPSGWTLPCPHLNIGPCCLGHGNHLRLDGFGSSKNCMAGCSQQDTRVPVSKYNQGPRDTKLHSKFVVPAAEVLCSHWPSKFEDSPHTQILERTRTPKFSSVKTSFCHC